MILRRLGNKAKIAAKIQAYFPQHDLYIEPFFGAGGMFFNKPKAKYNIVNDLDSDVFNLFQVNEQTGCKYAMSEFDNPFILNQAKERNLNVITIGERQNLKNRRAEILITNYKDPQMKLF